MKEKVIKLLVKWGYNSDSAVKMVEENLDIALKMYPESKPSFIADVVCTL